MVLNQLPRLRVGKNLKENKLKKLTLTIITLTLMLSTALASVPPKIYDAKLTQDSSRPEVVIELENTLGSVTYERIEEGRFRLTCEQCFPDETKVSGLREFHFTDTQGKYLLEWDDEGGNGNSLILTTYNAQGVLSDNILSVTEIRIAVYE